MEFLSQTYVALRGPTGAPQTASDTIVRLSGRLSPATLLADRRAAVLALKGLARDCKADVGNRALDGLLQVLYNDAEVDGDIGKAAIETLSILCDVEDNKELGFKHTDIVLADEKAAQYLFALLADNNFYTRLATLQYLSLLLQNRRQVVQKYFLTAKVGVASVISALEDKREIIRNEAIGMMLSLVSHSPDIQKILAFEGAFEKLFNIITQEGGIEGGIVAQEALTCVDTLLRYNSSNQSYFHETGLPPVLSQLLLFPPNLQVNEAAPQEFALQFWDDQKMNNASHLVSIIGMLVTSKGTPQESNFMRCLIELALASNAPTPLKTKALHLLPPSLNFSLSDIFLTPYMPVPDTNGEEWDRLEPASALDAVVELALHGEYNGIDGGKRAKEGLELRAAAAAVFENFVRKEEIRNAIVQAMVPPEGGAPTDIPTTPLILALASTPDTSSILDPAAVTATHFATILFSHLLRSSTRTKALALQIMPHLQPPAAQEGGNFFVPADGAPAPVPEPQEEDDEPPQSLLQMLTEGLNLSFLSRTRAKTSDRESREWDRLIVGYLSLLAQWLWEEPGSVREFLNAGGLNVLAEQVNQVSDADPIVPGLCAFLLGICYEYNREPGEITRGTIYPIINRLGIDTLAGRLVRLREDERFKTVGPESVVLPYPTPSSHSNSGLKPQMEGEAEIWFDWAFVDFWKSNYYSIQRGFSVEPDQLSSSSGQNTETTMLVASLREVIRKQSEEVETLRKELARVSVPAVSNDELTALKSQVASLTEQLSQSEEKRKDVEKEQEDLLVLLDEVSSKRKRDKSRLREAGLEVSEDEGDEDDAEE